jgi:ketosteroid isomerase-like protein
VARPDYYGNPAGLVDEIEVVRGLYEAFERRDLEAMLAGFSEDADLHFEGTARLAGRAEPYRGHDGVRRYFRDVAEVWDELRVVPTEFRQNGDRVLVTGRVSARSPSRIVAGSTGWIWRLRDGVVEYVRVYPSAADAMAAFEGRGV